MQRNERRHWFAISRQCELAHKSQTICGVKLDVLSASRQLDAAANLNSFGCHARLSLVPIFQQ
jgi:hypothetical protein